MKFLLIRGCKPALRGCQSASYKAIKAILEKKLDEEAFFDDTAPADLSSIYRGHAENQRQPLAHN